MVSGSKGGCPIEKGINLFVPQPKFRLAFFQKPTVDRTRYEPLGTTLSAFHCLTDGTGRLFVSNMYPGRV